MALPDEAPGYSWLREKLHDLVNEPPGLQGEPTFDAKPDFDSQEPIPERDPFPAFFWKMNSQDHRVSGILEVFVGWDVVVFHQSAMCAAQAGEGKAALHRLIETVWVGRHFCPEALFTAEFTQVSHLEAVDLHPWSDVLKACTFSSQTFDFVVRNPRYELRFGIDQGTIVDKIHYQGLVLVERVVADQGVSLDSETLHFDASGFITRLITLLSNASKITWQSAWAKKKQRSFGEDLSAHRVELSEMQQRRAKTLPTPLARGEFERLQRIYHAVYGNLDRFHQAAQTCRLNLRQFETLSRQLLHAQDPWVRDRLPRLQRLVDDLQEALLNLQMRAQSLQAEVHLLLSTEGRFAGDYVPELIRMPGTPANRRLLEGLSPLILVCSSDEVSSPVGSTIWIVRSERSSGVDGDLTPSPLVLRPREISLTRKEDLIGLYVEALEECPPDALRLLLKALCHPDGRLQLVPEGSGQTRYVQIGKIFANSADRKEFKSAESDILGFLDHSVSRGYSSASIPMEQDGVGMLCLISFVQAVTRVLNEAPHHLASVAEERLSVLPRLLFLLAFLHAVCGQGDEARGYLRRAARSALGRRDFPWAYFVAQFSREYGQRWEKAGAEPEPAVGLGKPREQPWKELAGDFLDAYDLRSAVGLARTTISTQNGRTPFSRPWGIRAWLWGLAVIVGAALLIVDAWLSTGPRLNQRNILTCVGALAIFAAPAALGLGARTALRQLFPSILYPRILGAITLATVTFCATQETSALTSARPIIIALLVPLCLVGSFLYLYFEVRKKVKVVRESFLRCLDIFSLAFLEAVCLGTIFALAYEGMFQQALASQGGTSCLFTVGEIFLRPRNIVLIAVLSILIGIVIQLLFEPTSKSAENDNFPSSAPTSHG